MENNKGRVLAYKMAKEIDNKELAEVSGGSTHISTSTTFRPTGANGDVEAFIDIRVDW